MHISSSVWVLHTPNDGQNILFRVFSMFLKEFDVIDIGDSVCGMFMNCRIQCTYTEKGAIKTKAFVKGLLPPELNIVVGAVSLIRQLPI